jgi:hypothetical protein
VTDAERKKLENELGELKKQPPEFQAQVVSVAQGGAKYQSESTGRGGSSRLRSRLPRSRRS